METKLGPCTKCGDYKKPCRCFLESENTRLISQVDNKGVRMDNSVKMRLAMKDSPEGDWIQDLWVPKVGDAYYILPTAFTREYWPKAENKIGHIKTTLMCAFLGCEYCYWEAPDAVLYLPSIEDYLGMLPSPVENIAEILMDIEEWLSQEYGDSFAFIHYSKIPFKTWPELILAFVQHKVKSLSWDGEGWR